MADGFPVRYRRPAQCRQVDLVQCADRHPGGAGGQLSLLHDRAQCRPRRRARRAPRYAGQDRQIGDDHPDAARNSSISPGWCAARRRAKGWATSSSAHIREVDAVLYVLRCFESTDITHVEGSVDPLRDADTVETELMLADMDGLERRTSSAGKKAKGGDKEAKAAAADTGKGARRAPSRQAGPVRCR